MEKNKNKNLIIGLIIVVLAIVVVVGFEGMSSKNKSEGNLTAGPCIRNTPDIVGQNDPTFWVHAGAVEQDRFELTNTDSLDCAPATFTFQVLMPTTANSMDASSWVRPYNSVPNSFFQNYKGLIPIKVGPGKSISDNYFEVKVPENAQPGHYSFRVKVSRTGNNVSAYDAYYESPDYWVCAPSETSCLSHYTAYEWPVVTPTASEILAITPTNVTELAKTPGKAVLSFNTGANNVSYTTISFVDSYEIYNGSTLLASIPRVFAEDRDYSITPTVVVNYPANTNPNFHVKAKLMNGNLVPTTPTVAPATAIVSNDNSAPSFTVQPNLNVAIPSLNDRYITWTAQDNKYVKSYKLVNQPGNGEEIFCKLLSSTSSFSTSGHTVTNICEVDDGYFLPEDTTYNVKLYIYDIEGNQKASNSFSFTTAI